MVYSQILHAAPIWALVLEHREDSNIVIKDDDPKQLNHLKTLRHSKKRERAEQRHIRHPR